ncbi:MAG TPA: hypothetical protein VFL51_10830 [Pseudolabrys sp.]|nr:hypothetical protein [Pseudolabrys sp.]
MTEEYRLDRPVAVTCPECGGAMNAEHTGSLMQFRCHIGHILTAEAMLESHSKMLETKLSAALVALNERAELCRQLSDTAILGSDIEGLNLARAEALERAQIIKRLLESEWRQISTGTTEK